LGKTQAIADIVQLIKGESTFWINKNKFCPYNFAWQDDYFAVSVSESHVKKVTEYIENQERHHANKTYAQETDEFISKFGFQLIKDRKK
jgi:REP element-mobilizing transposase RayT